MKCKRIFKKTICKKKQGKKKCAKKTKSVQKFCQTSWKIGFLGEKKKTPKTLVRSLELDWIAHVRILSSWIWSKRADSYHRKEKRKKCLLFFVWCYIMLLKKMHRLHCLHILISLISKPLNDNLKHLRALD